MPRVINIVKNTILKCPSNSLRKLSVEAVKTRMVHAAETILQDFESGAVDIPKQVQAVNLA